MKPLSCNYLWSIKHLIMFIVQVCSEWHLRKCTFQQKGVTYTSCYMVELLTCQSAILTHVWVGICHTKDASHRMYPSHCACMLSRRKLVVLMHWRDIRANINEYVAGYLWKMMMIFAVLLINTEKDCNVQLSARHIHLTCRHSRSLKVHVSGTRN